MVHDPEVGQVLEELLQGVRGLVSADFLGQPIEFINSVLKLVIDEGTQLLGLSFPAVLVLLEQVLDEERDLFIVFFREVY